MTEYWKSQEKTFCDICKCWLTDNKSSIDFHKNGKRHKENVDKRLKEIQNKNKANEKRDKRFEQEMKRIENAALAAYQKDGDSFADLSAQEKLTDSETKSANVATLDEDSPYTQDKEAKVVTRKESSKPSTSIKLISGTSTQIGTIGSWKPVAPRSTGQDLELPMGNRPKQELKLPEKRKIEFHEKSVTSLDTNDSSTWIKSEGAAVVAFKKRKPAHQNARQRLDDN